MATHCPSCNDANTQALVSNQQCLSCGTVFDFNGDIVPSAGQNLVGNFADLQRGGGFVATGKSNSMADGVKASPLLDTLGASAAVEADGRVVTPDPEPVPDNVVLENIGKPVPAASAAGKKAAKEAEKAKSE